MAIDKKKIGKLIEISATAIGAMFVAMSILAKKKKGSSVYDDEPEQKNPLEGKKVIFVENDKEKVNADGRRGYLEAVGDTDYNPGFYVKYVKRGLDVIFSFCGLVVLSPIFAAIALAIKIDDPGPILFSQKRMGQNKQYFKLHKFRSMKMSTPHDVPTHQLKNPEQYITNVGKFLRAHSLDELPQIWDIFIGNMSLIGPRPGLWNQDILTSERDKYGANDVKPGLTGWAQINGRDELEITDKAKLDGEYVSKIGPAMDVKCFVGSLHVLSGDSSVVEGGTGRKKNNELDVLVPQDCIVSVIMATYKRDEALRNALRSLSTQTYNNFEVILVDDNDSLIWNEKVANIVSDFTEAFGIDVKLIVNHPNQGSARSRNNGIEAAEGEYIIFLDDDDIYLECRIENQLKVVFGERADYSITDLSLYNEDDTLNEVRKRDYLLTDEGKKLMVCHLKYHMTGTDTMMFRTDYIRKIGGFDPIDVGDEYYLMMKAIKEGGKFVYAPVNDVKAYVHTGESGLSSGQGKLDGENRLFEYKKQYFKELNARDIRYIKMRHHAVRAYAYKRNKNNGWFIIEGIKAFFFAPYQCLILLKGLKG